MFLSLLGAMAGTTLAQVAAPMTTDHACWMMDKTGQIISMAHLCPAAEPTILDAGAAITGEATGIPEIASTPMAGTVCADFASQPEAQFHFLQGSAPASLDRDNDGIACDDLPTASSNRTGGSLVNTYRSTRFGGVDIELFDVGRRNIGGDFYLRVTAPGLGVFTTRSFANKTNAIEHVRTYYGYTQGL